MRWFMLLCLGGCTLPSPTDGPSSDTVVTPDPPDVQDTDAPVDTPTPDTDIEEPLAPPTPADPCGDDLDADNGAVAPDLGDVDAPGAFSGNPAERGSWEVVSRTTSIPNADSARDEIRLTSVAPAEQDEAAEGPFPLVLFMPGFGASHTQYTSTIETLASHGFVVVGMDFPNTGFTDPARHDLNADEAMQALDWITTDGPDAERVDATKIAALGHSQGGKIGFYAAALDPRIDIVVGLDPQNGGGPPCFIDDFAPGDCNDFPVAPNCEAEDSGILHQMRAETLVFGADDPRLTPDAHLRAASFYRGAPSPAHWVYFPDASHAAWVGDGEDSVTSRRVYTALLLTRLKGYTGLEEFLPGGSWLDSVDRVEDHRTK